MTPEMTPGSYHATIDSLDDALWRLKRARDNAERGASKAVLTRVHEASQILAALHDRLSRGHEGPCE